MTAQKPLTEKALFRKKVKVTIQGKMTAPARPAIRPGYACPDVLCSNAAASIKSLFTVAQSLHVL